jgi:hypothetical protein
MGWFWSRLAQHFHLASMLENCNFSEIPTVRLSFYIQLFRSHFSLSQSTTFVFRKFFLIFQTLCREHVLQIPTVRSWISIVAVYLCDQVANHSITVSVMFSQLKKAPVCCPVCDPDLPCACAMVLQATKAATATRSTRW